MASPGSVLCAALIAFLFVVTVRSTIVKNCQGKTTHGEMKKVEISNCEKAPCILKKNTTSDIMIRFKPKEDVDSLRNKVFAKIIGIPFPFLGVDGMLSCENVFGADGVTEAGCPLKAGQDYVYKNSFDILNIYPTLSPLVHWGLVDADTEQYVVCFEIQTRIIANQIH